VEFEAEVREWSTDETEAEYGVVLEGLVPLSLQAGEIFKQAYGAAHHVTLTHLARHARCVSLQGRPREAGALFEKACGLMGGSKELKQTPPHAHALANQAHNHLRVGECAEAELAFADALHIMRRRPESFLGRSPDHYATNFERQLARAKGGGAVVRGRYAGAGAKYEL